MLAAVAGLGAHGVSKRKLEEAWLRDHVPGAEVWRAALAARGYGPVRNDVQVRALLRSLTSLAEPKGQALRSPDGAWIAIFGDPDRETDPVRFEAQAVLLTAPSKVWRARMPRSWDSLGQGWPALERVVGEARMPAAAFRGPRPARRPRGDPREIRY